MRRPHAAAAAAVLLWLAVLTVAFHGCGGRLGCGGFLVPTLTTTTKRTGPAAAVVAVTRKMLLAVTTSSFDTAASPTNHHPHRHHHHHHPHRHHHHHRRHVGRWNRQGIPPSPAGGEFDPRYGVEKRLVPTGPNPLHH